MKQEIKGLGDMPEGCSVMKGIVENQPFPPTSCPILYYKNKGILTAMKGSKCKI